MIRESRPSGSGACETTGEIMRIHDDHRARSRKARSASAIIEVRDAVKRFGGLYAVDRCSLEVEAGSVTGLIGPNGAGKTTLFNMVTGTWTADGGSILFDGRDVTRLPAHRRFDLGLLRTFQIPHEFARMSALENLMVVPPDQAGENIGAAWLRRGRVRREEERIRTRAEEVIDFIGLAHVKNELAGNLSGGQKKLLELGRTMMTDAKAVLLDEIGAGVNRTLLNKLLDNIERLNREHGYTFFVIEHDMDLVARLCDPVIVMTQGRVLMEGSLEEAKANPEVVAAYFGGTPSGAGAPP